MNHNEEVPDNMKGLGDMLPADVLKKVNELLEQLHRKDKDHQGSPVFVYAPGSQYVDKQFNIEAYPRLLPKGKGVDSAEASKSLPDVLATDKAMALWRKAQRAGYVDEHYQPLLSRTQAALLADASLICCSSNFICQSAIWLALLADASESANSLLHRCMA